ncbi:MAG: hypothetical protein EPO55_16660 [Reyranella sp.]|uniref:hypothetical protein n=1 Tax=Reyranella sp. TaxID=1929291 RepID=UPI001200DF4F|nr:hypothetical protein [Reyranella sp.]TAJ38140.1 MAG: hypothetical protein EPO55_16660 [Reyranella sp.]
MKTRDVREEDLAIVAGCLRRARLMIASLFGGALLAITGAAWLWNAGLLGAGQGGRLFGAVLVGSLLVIAVKLGLLLQRRSAIEESAVFRLLRDQPGRVLWTFPTALRTNVLGIDIEAEQLIILCTDDARIERVRGVRKSDVQKVAAAVRRLTPGAYYGLTDANRRRFQKTTGFVVK